MYIRSLALKKSWETAAKDALKISIFVFLLIMSSHLRVYLPYSPVPVTFQTLVILLSVVFLGRRAFSVPLVYSALGIAGLEVFSGGRGVLYLFGPTGGYIAGFLAASVLLASMLDMHKNFAWYIFSFGLASLVILICGSLWIAFSLKTSFAYALTIGLLPFLYGDSLKVVLAALITRLVKS
jgi:biotin transport system substrate-specific component